MAIELKSLNLQINTSLINLSWNDQIIEIQEYKPFSDKLQLIQDIATDIMGEANYTNSNPCIVDFYITLNVIRAYTNIEFNKENQRETYDLLISSGLWDAIKDAMAKTGEYEYIVTMVNSSIDEFYKYKNSVLGIIEAVSRDYGDMTIEAENIQKNLADPENLTLLKDVVTKLG